MHDSDNDAASRRGFLKALGLSALAAGAALAGCKPEEGSGSANGPIPKGQMTYRTHPRTGDKVSLLGYGCMRWPTLGKDGELDQEAINALVDTALEHGVNYFDTSPAYCKGASERATGIALARHPRESYFIATKLSNFAKESQNREKSLEMYHNSFKELQVSYIDYMLLHSVGGGSGMQLFRERYIDNGILDFLLAEREAGRIRHLGFSFHGNVEVFDYLLAHHETYKWDFVQIQMNYLDWRNASGRNVQAEYLYNELDRRGIPVVIMEPLLGGRLAQVPDSIAARLKQREPGRSVASWAFRFAGTYPRVLTVLSGMTYREHLEDNLRTYCPLKPLTDEEKDFLQDTATLMSQYKTIPCNDCKYCMPCPYGLDIPAILLHYNKCINEGDIVPDARSADYARARRAFLTGYGRAVIPARQADRCIGCGKCMHHCPQGIAIPKELQMIDRYVEQLKRGQDIMEQLVRKLKSGSTTFALTTPRGGSFESTAGGVTTLRRLLADSPEALRGAWVADKVVGKAAAALMVLGGVRELHAGVISDAGVKMLRRGRIRATYDERVEEIRNRDNTGLCPLEAACADAKTPEECAQRLDEFLKNQAE